MSVTESRTEEIASFLATSIPCITRTWCRFWITGLKSSNVRFMLLAHCVMLWHVNSRFLWEFWKLMNSSRITENLDWIRSIARSMLSELSSPSARNLFKKACLFSSIEVSIFETFSQLLSKTSVISSKCPIISSRTDCAICKSSTLKLTLSRISSTRCSFSLILEKSCKQRRTCSNACRIISWSCKFSIAFWIGG